MSNSTPTLPIGATQREYSYGSSSYRFGRHAYGIGGANISNSANASGSYNASVTRTGSTVVSGDKPTNDPSNVGTYAPVSGSTNAPVSEVTTASVSGVTNASVSGVTNVPVNVGAYAPASGIKNSPFSGVTNAPVRGVTNVLMNVGTYGPVSGGTKAPVGGIRNAPRSGGAPVSGGTNAAVGGITNAPNSSAAPVSGGTNAPVSVGASAPVSGRPITPEIVCDNRLESDSAYSENEFNKHEIFANFNMLIYECLRCGQPYDSEKEAADSYNNERCFPRRDHTPVSTCIYLNFPSSTYLCFGCGKEFDKFFEALSHSQSATCKKQENHRIMLNFENESWFFCNNKSCEEAGTKFHSLNNALDHWKTENFPNPNAFTELPAKHMVFLDSYGNSHQCRNCEKQFQSINEAWAHWMSKNVTRLSLQKFWIDFNNKEMICARCGAHFSDPQSADEHRSLEETIRPAEHEICLNTTSGLLTCQTCEGEKFRKFADAIEHLKIETIFMESEGNRGQSIHQVSPKFDSGKLCCKACDRCLPDLGVALAHSRHDNRDHYVEIDFQTGAFRCHGCDKHFPHLNGGAKHWKDEMWPSTVPGVKIASKHEITLDFKLNEFVCLNCDKSMKTLQDVAKHWKSKKMNKCVKHSIRMPFYACTGMFF